jgi:hypothetical protein
LLESPTTLSTPNTRSRDHGDAWRSGKTGFAGGKAHLDRQGSVVIDGGVVDDFGIARTAAGRCIVKHDVNGQQNGPAFFDRTDGAQKRGGN